LPLGIGEDACLRDARRHRPSSRSTALVLALGVRDGHIPPELPESQTEKAMSKHPAILPVATTVLLSLAAGACATRGDVQALRSDVAALQASTESAMAAHAAGPGSEYQQLRSDIAALQASIRSAGATRDAGATAAPAEYRELR
jgi:hypothetical protein